MSSPSSVAAPGDNSPREAIPLDEAESPQSTPPNNQIVGSESPADKSGSSSDTAISTLSADGRDPQRSDGKGIPLSNSDIPDADGIEQALQADACMPATEQPTVLEDGLPLAPAEESFTPEKFSELTCLGGSVLAPHEVSDSLDLDHLPIRAAVERVAPTVPEPNDGDDCTHGNDSLREIIQEEKLSEATRKEEKEDEKKETEIETEVDDEIEYNDKEEGNDYKKGETEEKEEENEETESELAKPIRILEEVADESPSQLEWIRQKQVYKADNIHLDKLMRMVGLEGVKEYFLAVKVRVEMAKKQGTVLRKNFDVVFEGNPGTGESSR
jgi:hypothetical protein